MILRSKYLKDWIAPDFYLCDEHTTYNEQNFLKYLGHYLDANLKVDRYIQCQYLYVRGNMLIRKCKMCSRHLWIDYKKASMHRLIVSQCV